MRPFFHTTSLKRKLLTVMITTSGVVLVVASLAFVVNETVTFRENTRQELTALANIIELNTTAAVTFGDQKAAAETLAALGAKPYILSAYILAGDGQVFAKYLAPGAAPDRLRLEPGPGEPVPGRRSALAAIEDRSGRWWDFWSRDLIVAKPMLLDEQAIGTIVIQSDFAEMLARLKWFFVMAALIMAAAMAVAFALANRLQRPISDPIVRLAETMKTVTERQNYALRVQKQSSDEIGQLFDGFNDMLAQIQQRDTHLERYAAELQESNEELKGFIYSAAHDLRAPLVNIKGFVGELASSLRQVEGICARPPEALAGTRDGLLQIVRTEMPTAMEFIDSSVKRVDTLINAMLKLARIGHRSLHLERIDLDALVQGLVQSFQHQIEQKHATVAVAPLPPVVADRTALEQVLSNLLDNALKYLAPGNSGRVEISGERIDGEVTVRVRDNGRGIAADDMPKLFKMFRRLGTQDVPGEGMGLAYVRAQVRRHGGRIWCESEPGVGSTFSFTVPQRRKKDHS